MSENRSPEHGPLVATSTQHVRWVRPPRQVRSQETLDRILDAAEAVVSEKGFERASISEIVQRGTSSVGAFYQRFRDKDALLGCLHDRFCEEAIATTDEALNPELWKDASVREILTELIRFLVAIYEQRRGLLRAFIVRGCIDPSFAEDGARLSQYIIERLSRLLLARRHEMTHPDPELAVAFGLRGVFDKLDFRAVHHELFDRPWNDPRILSEELTRTYVAYLGVD